MNVMQLKGLGSAIKLMSMRLETRVSEKYNKSKKGYPLEVRDKEQRGVFNLKP